MKIDAHQHFWSYTQAEYGWIDDSMKILQQDRLPADLLPLLQAHEIKGTIAVQARQTLEETRWLLQLAESNSFIKGVVGWVDLCSKTLDEQLAEFSSFEKLVGIRHVIQDEPDDRFILRTDFLRGIEKLQKYNLTYDILIYPRHLPYASEFVRMFPEQPFVLDHIAKPPVKEGIFCPWNDDIRQLAEFPNIYCKVSGMVTEADWKHWQFENMIPYLDIVFESFGPERLLFGSDWPVCTVAAAYEQVVHLFHLYVLTQELSMAEKKAVWGGNAQKIYNLDK